jgi:hypothetical protein
MRIFAVLLSLLLITIIVISVRGEAGVEQIQEKAALAVTAGNQGNTPAGIQKMVTSAIDVRQDAQKREDDWAAEREKLTARYRSLKADREYLKKVKERTERMLHVKEMQIADTLRMIEESIRIREELQSYLESVSAKLEGQIKVGLPFLLKERADRLASIREILVLPDKPPAEKYRRVMEALRIEAGYGRTVEVYQDKVELRGEKRLIDILRVGRLSLFCRTPDGRVVGGFDQESQRWAVLPSRYRREINKAVDIAGRRRAIELIGLPIGRILIP